MQSWGYGCCKCQGVRSPYVSSEFFHSNTIEYGVAPIPEINWDIELHNLFFLHCKANLILKPNVLVFAITNSLVTNLIHISQVPLAVSWSRISFQGCSKSGQVRGVVVQVNRFKVDCRFYAFPASGGLFGFTVGNHFVNIGCALWVLVADAI